MIGVMELIIDNQPIDVHESDGTPLRDVLERVSQELKGQNRVISEIYLDGREMGGWDDPLLASKTIAQVSILKLVSEEPRKLAHKVLYEIASYMPNIREALVNTSVLIQSRKEEEGLRLLEKISETWADLYVGLQNAITVTGLDTVDIPIGNKTFGEINGEVQELLDQVMILVEEQQFLELSDLLEYELAPRIPNLEEGIYRIIREIEKKPH